MQTAHSQGWEHSPFRLDQCGDLTPLREALQAADYTQSTLTELARRRYRLEPIDVDAMVRRVVLPTPFNTLVRLFFLGLNAPEGLARKAVAPMDFDQLVAVGLLEHTAGGVRAAAMLFPYDDLYVVYDFPVDIVARPLPANCVLGVGGASTTLAHLTVRRQGETVFDLGTGSGIHALLAARHAQQVIAGDVNPRALNFAALNVRLNGLSNITLRQASLYEPVTDCQFDLIVANPPFVISPESRYVYRDSDLPGDAISEQVICGAGPRLREGGYAVMLCNWYHRQGQSWSERPEQWVMASGCDTWILGFETYDPLTYASTWLRPTEGHGPDDYGQLLDAWLEYYQRMGIESITAGAIILRRRAASTHWKRAEVVQYERGAGSCSDQIQRIFAAQDFLENMAHEEQLLDQWLVLTQEHQLQHTLKAENGGWHVEEAVLRQEQGLACPTHVDRLVATVLAGCNGHHTLREVVTDVANGLGVAVGVVAPPALRVIRQLMQMGFLSVAERQPPGR